MRRKKVRYKINGKEVARTEFNKNPKEGVPTLQNSDHWRGYVSQGLGCHSSQIDSLNEEAKKHGITGVRYRKDKHGGGVCEVSSRKQRAKLLKSRGLVDNDGGFGDG
jgi:hypothetical protein